MRFAATKTEALKKKRELLNQLEKDGAESFTGDRTKFSFLAKKFKEEKLISAVYVGDKKIAGRRELSAPRTWLAQLEYVSFAKTSSSFIFNNVEKPDITC